MLNIKDIEEELLRNPEPNEVKEMRDKITHTFTKLLFEEGPHKYYLPHTDGSKEELISVSKLIEQFEPEADWDAITARYAEKHNMTIEAVKRMWHENNIRATSQGTGVHLFGEMYMHFIQGHPERICDVIKPQYEDGFLIPHSPKECAVEQYNTDIFNTKGIWPVMPETKVYIGINGMYPFKQKYAGTFDILHAYKAHNGKWKAIIHDYKTNTSLSSSYNQSKGVYMKHPFDEMIDEAKSHYALQLSAYQVCLQQLGYEVADRKLIWLKDDGTYEKVQVPDMSERIIKTLS